MPTRISTAATRPLRRIASPVIFGSLVIAACGGDEPTNAKDDIGSFPDDGVTLLAFGSVEEETVELPVPWELGQTSTSEFEISVGVAADLGGQELDLSIAFDMTLSQEVVDVTADGATVEAVFDAGEIADAPFGVGDEALESFDPLLGETIVFEFDDRGAVVGDVTFLDGSSLPAEFADTFDSATNEISFPTEPVGVGARWSALSEVEAAGVTIEAVTEYELVEITSDSLVIRTTQDVPIDADVDGADISGTLTGEGTTTVDRTNPLAIQVTFDQSGDLDVSGGGASGSMTLANTFGVSST